MASQASTADRLHRLQRVSWLAALALLVFSVPAIGTPRWPVIVLCWAGLLAASFTLTVVARRADEGRV